MARKQATNADLIARRRSRALAHAVHEDINAFARLRARTRAQYVQALEAAQDPGEVDALETAFMIIAARDYARQALRFHQRLTRLRGNIEG